MDRQERGLLLVEKEEIADEEKKSRAALAEAGSNLVKFGTLLIHGPQNIAFADAPTNSVLFHDTCAWNRKWIDWTGANSLTNRTSLASLWNSKDWDDERWT